MFARKVLDFDSHNVNRLRRMIRALYREFDGLFVLNTDQKKWLTGREMGFNKKNVFQTAHWVEEKFKPKKSKRSKLFGVKENEQVLLFTGRVSTEKGVNEIPDIYQKIKNDFPDVRIVFAGSGPAEKELKKEFPDGIFLGWVDHEKLPEIYSAADLLLLPSKFDTFGVVVLEAMSCGLPVIAYKTKGPKDIIQHNRNGYLVKTRSEMVTSIRSFLKNKEKQKKFKERALERALEYNADNIIGKMMKEINLPADV
jgi:glycosyltransferase involved in cell wall biosynthesis